MKISVIIAITEVFFMYREITAKLIEWKNNTNKKPLIISGARQVGKTYSILEFAKQAYTSYIYINFERDLDVKRQFEASANPKELIMYLQVKYPNTLENESLIILDEIQACPQALTTLKFLGNETTYDYIASGSLLGVAIHHTSSYPVGYVQSLDMQPMNFREFLYANRIKPEQIDYLKKCFDEKRPVLEGVHTVFDDLLKKYILCGGMPEVVKTFIETNNLNKVMQVQRQIVEDYYRDMAKYAQMSDKIKTHDCFISIPQQLSKENKKFQYKLVRSGGNASIFESSLQWLLDSGTIQKCTRIKCIEKPIKAYQETSIFKIYMADTGLLISMFEDDIYKQLLEGNLGVYKGAIYENIAAQILKANGHDLYYFEPSSHSEIDFIIQKQEVIIPIEIKSSHNTKAKSLKAYVEKYQPQVAYKFSTNNISVQQNIINYPLYMMMFV